jgi:uncharacterized protein YydD (DUF2326 family)
MIHYVTASDPGFKSIVLRPGLNVLLAEKTQASSSKHTRNSSGKSRFVDLLHFLLGANNSIPFNEPPLDDWFFAMVVDVAGTPTLVARTGSDASNHHILTTEGYETISLAAWKRRLGAAFFTLPSSSPSYSPSYRSLISYLVRVERDGGMRSPFTNRTKQQTWDSQVAISFFLGLDWRIPSKLERVRDEEKRVQNLLKSADAGELGSVVSSTAKLRTQLALAAEEARETRRKLDGFKVLDEYNHLRDEADQLTKLLRDLRDLDASDRDLLYELDLAQAEEAPPGAEELRQVWEQANVLLSDSVIETFDRVRQFHESVIANRVSYLAREAAAAEARLADREAERVRIMTRRQELIATLESGGALEQFTGMQVELGRQEGRITALRDRLDLAESFEGGKAKTERDRQELYFQLQEDYHERSETLDKVIALFERYSRRLYDDRRGALVVEATSTGPKFSVEIEGKGSVGIDSMQILCFDFLLMTLLQEAGKGPGVLVHDSHMFDGVDARQVAQAIEFGAFLAEDLGFQYIITMNSDAPPV